MLLELGCTDAADRVGLVFAQRWTDALPVEAWGAVHVPADLARLDPALRQSVFRRLLHDERVRVLDFEETADGAADRALRAEAQAVALADATNATEAVWSLDDGTAADDAFFDALAAARGAFSRFDAVARDIAGAGRNAWPGWGGKTPDGVFHAAFADVAVRHRALRALADGRRDRFDALLARFGEEDARRDIRRLLFFGPLPDFAKKPSAAWEPLFADHWREAMAAKPGMWDTEEWFSHCRFFCGDGFFRRLLDEMENSPDATPDWRLHCAVERWTLADSRGEEVDDEAAARRFVELDRSRTAGAGRRLNSASAAAAPSRKRAGRTTLPPPAPTWSASPARCRTVFAPRRSGPSAKPAFPPPPKTSTAKIPDASADHFRERDLPEPERDRLGLFARQPGDDPLEHRRVEADVHRAPSPHRGGTSGLWTHKYQIHLHDFSIRASLDASFGDNRHEIEKRPFGEDAGSSGAAGREHPAGAHPAPRHVRAAGGARRREPRDDDRDRARLALRRHRPLRLGALLARTAGRPGARRGGRRARPPPPGRNHGFLLEDRGWRLSPAYDLNPNPETAGALSLCIDNDDATADFSLALRVAPHFRLAPAEADAILARVREAVAPWRSVAAARGIPARQIDTFRAAFSP